MKWTIEEEEYLIINYSDMRNEDISYSMGRSIGSIAKKSHSLKLSKSKSHRSKMIGKRNKIVGRDLSFDNLINISKKYKTRGEFQLNDPSAYTVSRINFGLNNICKHMLNQQYSTPQLLLYKIIKIIFKDCDIIYNDRKELSPYELDIYIPEYKLAFEYDGKIWHKNNEKNKIKNNMCDNKGILLLRIIENNRNYLKDIKNQLINYIEIINKRCFFNLSYNDILTIDDINLYLSIKNEILNIEDIKNIISKYKYYSDFKKNECKIYYKLIKNKMLTELTGNLIRIHIKWDMILLKKTISKYSDYSTFLKNETGCYLYIKKNKLEYLLKDLNRKKNTWNIEKIKKLIINNNYNTMYKIKKYYPGAFSYIKRNNLISECRKYIKERG